MRILIATIGSRGDIQPYIALGIGLRAAGYQVRLATHGSFEQMIQKRGLEFTRIEGNPREIMGGEVGQEIEKSGKNLLRFMYEYEKISEQMMGKVLDELWQASQDVDLILCSALSYPGYYVAEKRGIPAFPAFLQPEIPTRAFPSPSVSPSFSLGRTYNVLTHKLTEQIFWQFSRQSANRLRQQKLGLPPISWRGPFKRMREQHFPFLCGYSPHVVPKPSDWGEEIHVTGYWFLDTPDWQPSARLIEFLEAGAPPIYIGFGSMSNQEPEKMLQLVLQALEHTKQRGIIVTGWGGLVAENLPEYVLGLDEAPHHWLFPRMAAVVHHGGAGTTAAGLRAGVPSIVIPFFGDQPFWGERVFRLGVGPRPIPRKKLTAEKLAEAIKDAVDQQEMKARAAALGERIRAEDGVKQATKVIKQLFATGQPLTLES